MSHNIRETDSGFSVVQMPWHHRKEMVVLDEAPKDTLDALGKSGLGWGVVQEPVYRKVDIPDPDNPNATFEMYVPVQDSEDVKYNLNYRSDNGAVLGIVTEAYQPVQNVEAFTFLDALLGGDVVWETAGSHGGGKWVWVLVRFPEHVEMAGDAVAQYLYAANSHDGSMAVTASPTAIRIVCKNTWTAALRSSTHGRYAQNTYRFRHTGNLTAKFAEARRVMGLTVDWSRTMKQVADQLGLVKLTDKKAEEYTRELSIAKVQEGMTDRMVGNREQIVKAILNIYHGEGPQGDTRGNAPGTAWTWFQAVGEHADHGRRITKRTSLARRALEDNTIQQEALDLVLADA